MFKVIYGRNSDTSPRYRFLVETCILSGAGMHCEGGVWATLFGLLFWSVLFADVPGVFRTPFQSAPLDMCADTFTDARRELVEGRLQEIRCPYRHRCRCAAAAGPPPLPQQSGTPSASGGSRLYSRQFKRLHG